jgi:hypothetical protein
VKRDEYQPAPRLWYSKIRRIYDSEPDTVLAFAKPRYHQLEATLLGKLGHILHNDASRPEDIHERNYAPHESVTTIARPAVFRAQGREGLARCADCQNIGIATERSLPPENVRVNSEQISSDDLYFWVIGCVGLNRVRIEFGRRNDPQTCCLIAGGHAPRTGTQIHN